MNAHERALELGAARFDFDLSPGDRQALDGHIASCATCHRELGWMADDAKRLENRPDRRMPVEAATAVRSRLERPARPINLALVMVTAVLVLVAVLATLVVGAAIQLRLEDSRLAVEPVPSSSPVSPLPSPTLTPAASVPPQLAWAILPEPAVHPKRGFEHAFLDSERGTMIQIRHLEGAPTTIVASTRDGVAWATAEVPSGGIPAGQSVNGGADWMQLIHRKDGGLDLVASSDGFTWDRRGRLPDAIGDPWASAVNGSVILVCGSGVGPREGRAECAQSPDDGSTWTRLAELGRVIDMNAIRGVVPLGDGFMMIIEGPVAGESVALTSDDGIAWTRVADPVPNAATAVGVIGDTVVAYGATDTEASMASTSDGMTWTTAALPAIDGMVFEFVQVGDIVVAPVLRNQPEGAAYASAFLLSADGTSWVTNEAPTTIADWPSPTFLRVDGGLIALGGETGTILRGTLAAADAP